MAFFMVSCGAGGGGGTSSPAPTTGTATLTWTAPTTNVDGSPLNNLAGYRIYYGTQSGNYSNSIVVGIVTTHQITNLARGYTYYFKIRAFNALGVESDLSTEQSKPIS